MVSKWRNRRRWLWQIRKVEIQFSQDRERPSATTADLAGNSLITAYQSDEVDSTVSSNKNSICDPKRSSLGSGATTRCAYPDGRFGNEPTTTGADSYLVPMRGSDFEPGVFRLFAVDSHVAVEHDRWKCRWDAGVCAASCCPSRFANAIRMTATIAAPANTALQLRRDVNKLRADTGMHSFPIRIVRFSIAKILGIRCKVQTFHRVISIG